MISAYFLLQLKPTGVDDFETTSTSKDYIGVIGQEYIFAVYLFNFYCLKNTIYVLVSQIEQKYQNLSRRW